MSFLVWIVVSLAVFTKTKGSLGDRVLVAMFWVALAMAVVLDFAIAEAQKQITNWETDRATSEAKPLAGRDTP